MKFEEFLRSLVKGQRMKIGVGGHSYDGYVLQVEEDFLIFQMLEVREQIDPSDPSGPVGEKKEKKVGIMRAPFSRIDAISFSNASEEN